MPLPDRRSSPGSASATERNEISKQSRSQDQASSALQRIREEFHRCGGSKNMAISAQDLGKRWLSLTEEEQWLRGFGPLSTQDKQVIALRIAQLMHEMGLKVPGHVSLSEWVHYLLLTQSSRAALQINSLLKVAMKRHPRILEELQQMFNSADSQRSGQLSFREIVHMYSHKLWHVRAGSDGRPLSDAELREGDPEEFARDIVEAMDVEGDQHVTYAEFMAYCLGRRKHEVILHMYDLTNGMAQTLAPWLLGMELQGVWHTGVVVYGREYFFSRDTVFDEPGKTSFGKPTKIIHLGYTLWRQEEMHTYIVEELKPIYHRDSYDVYDNNCNNFSNSLCQYLLAKRLPEEVQRQPDFLRRSTALKILRPIMNSYLRDGIVAREKDGAKPVMPSSLSKRLSSDSPPVLPGTFVYIHPADHEGQPVLGLVCTPDGRPEGRPDNRAVASNTVREGAIVPAFLSCGCRCSDLATPALQNDSSVCVRYFKLNFFNPSECNGKLRTELVPRKQISIAKLDDVGGAHVYNMALQGMMCQNMPTSSKIVNSPASKSREEADAKTQLAVDKVCMATRVHQPAVVTNATSKAAEERAMEELVAMSFEAKIAAAALDSTDWRADAAVEMLLDEGSCNTTSKPGAFPDKPRCPDDCTNEVNPVGGPDVPTEHV
mmetsp:Transcript_114988/g.199404  ORF Transcript_114988/g.199404 Transcript_114988/m.199404 type:complete len:659 (+) Transcript_114988:93-2069(+)